MKILMGKTPARCIACSAEDWRAVDATAPLSLFSVMVCRKCGHRALCADLVLQMPFEEGQSRAQPIRMERWNEQWLGTFKRPPSR